VTHKLSLSVLAFMTLVPITRPARAQNILPIVENGRTVWVNASAAPTAAEVPPSQGPLVYWSHREGRWKPVEASTTRELTAAQSAANEVRRLVVAQAAKPVKRAPGNRNEGRTIKTMPARQTNPKSVERAIRQAAERHGVDENLVRAVVQVESGFNPVAVSPKGAMGLMQLMPQTARSLNVSNPFDPEENVEAGVRHLKNLLESYNGDVKLSLAAYNAGSGAVQRYRGIPRYPETKAYVQRITKLYGAPKKRSIAVRARDRGVP